MKLSSRNRSFTLVEVLIASGISVVIGFVLIIFLRNSYSIYLRGQTSSEVHLASDSLTTRLANAIRGTIQVTNATATSLTVISYFAPTDANPTQVTITKTGSNLTLTTIIGVPTGDTYTYPPNAAVTKTITKRFVAAPAIPLFQYYNESSTLLGLPAQPGAIHVIEITGTVFALSDSTKTSSISTKVHLRNLKTNL